MSVWVSHADSPMQGWPSTSSRPWAAQFNWMPSSWGATKPPSSNICKVVCSQFTPLAFSMVFLPRCVHLLIRPPPSSGDLPSPTAKMSRLPSFRPVHGSRRYIPVLKSQLLSVNTDTFAEWKINIMMINCFIFIFWEYFPPYQWCSCHDLSLLHFAPPDFSPVQKIALAKTS